MLGLLLLVGFFSVVVFFYYFLSENSTKVLEHKAGMDERREWSEETKLVKALEPFTKLLSPFTSQIPIPTFVAEKYQQMIVSAGFELYVNVKDIFGLQFVLAIGLSLMGNVWFGGDVMWIVIFSILGFFLPVAWLSQSANERRAQILRELPPVVDMIGLAVGAGLEFNEAIKRVVEKSNNDSSPLIYEFRVYLQHIRLNWGRAEALQEFGERVNSRDIFTFTGILIQTEKLGSSISETLKQQAARLREERFVAAEKAGAVAAQKIMLPMMVFIFPLVFAVIILPLILNYLYN